MSDVHDHSEFSGDELLAAEYALGVLAGPDRATAERRMARDRALRGLGRGLGAAACAVGGRDCRGGAAT